VVEAEPRPRAPRSSARRLKDISHLYLSGRAAPPPSWSVARRSLRLGVLGGPAAAPQAEVCANLAVQFARLRQRTLVLDLDARLPNVGFHLGLEPQDYLAHLGPSRPPRVARSLLGLRVAVGLASHTQATEALEVLHGELADSDCILVCLPALARGPLPVLHGWAAALQVTAPTTTLRRAAATSPMFEAWRSTAARPAAARPTGAWRPPTTQLLDAALCVVPAEPTDADDAALHEFAVALAPAPLHQLAWGEAAGAPAGPVWARVPAHGVAGASRQPLSSLDPDHPVSRLFESLAQSLLAGAGRRSPHA
jgi:hypothetical protein